MTTHQKQHVNREKYFNILKNDGLTAALTELHHEIKELEEECFEGEDGWDPQLWEDIKHFRAFSEELWQFRDLQQNAGSLDPNHPDTVISKETPSLEESSS